ncbi:MAG: hypothetical protein ACE5IK_14430, partial [Acidobacteriota bacterium]
GGLSFLLGIPAAFANGGSELFTGKHWLGHNFMDFMAMIFITYSLTVGALLICVFAGWAWKARHAAAELVSGYSGPGWLISGWSVLIRFVCPLAIALILAVLYFRPGVIPT